MSTTAPHRRDPDARGYFGSYGGRFVPETLVEPVEELERAARFLPVLDTIITLAPLLGLLGTVTGIMKAFRSIGNSDLAVQAVSGGIGEALIATACGLAIAIFCLLPFNYYQRRVSRLRFELETNATNLELMLERAKGYVTS